MPNILYYKVLHLYAIEVSYLSTVVAAAENLAWSWWLYFGIASAWWCQWQPRSGYQIRRFKRVSLKNRYFGTSITFKYIFYPRNDICVRSWIVCHLIFSLRKLVYTQTLRRMIWNCKILLFDVRRQQFHFHVNVYKFRGLLKHNSQNTGGSIVFGGLCWRTWKCWRSLIIWGSESSLSFLTHRSPYLFNSRGAIF